MIDLPKRARAIALAVILALSVASCSPGAESADEPTPTANNSSARPETYTVSDDFVEGNLFFIAYHELGHAAVSEFGLPIAGREEDAVDRLAIWMMTPESSEEAPDYLLDAMAGWFSLASEIPLEEIEWWDAHSTSQQRGYQIACLLYGSDAGRYVKLADDTEIPPDRRETCVDEAVQNDAAWDKLLATHERSETAPKDQSQVSIRYTPPGEFIAEQAYLTQIGLFDHLSELITSNFRFAPGISLVAEECGEANAYWSPGDRQLTICYELIRDFRRLGQTG